MKGIEQRVGASSTPRLCRCRDIAHDGMKGEALAVAAHESEVAAVLNGALLELRITEIDEGLDGFAVE